MNQIEPTRKGISVTRLWKPVALSCILVFAASCTWIGGDSSFKDDFDLKLYGVNPAEGPGEKSQVLEEGQTLRVRPGQALRVRVDIQNLRGKEVVVQYLNAESMSFSFWPEGNPMNQLGREPVFSPKEPMDLAQTLPPVEDQSVMWRDFTFVDVTDSPGRFYLQGRYNTPVQGSDDQAVGYTAPLPYVVEGEPMFQRDAGGLISKEDAIRLAKEELGRPTDFEAASLIENEAGFYDWWVTLRVTAEALAKGERAEKGYFVNPYVGFIRKQAKPNMEALETPQETGDVLSPPGALNTEP